MKIESEKNLERKLREETKKLGGWCLKLLCNHISGLPDRLVLLPGGIAIFAEIKTTKKKPTRIQTLVHNKIEKLGFEVHIIDTTEKIHTLLNERKRPT